MNDKVYVYEGCPNFVLYLGFVNELDPVLVALYLESPLLCVKNLVPNPTRACLNG